VLDLNALHKEWYDWTMKDGPRPKLLEKKVTYYVTGPGEEWKRADSLESIGAERRTLYLGSDGGRAGDAFHSGHLAAVKPAGAAPPDHFVYDPLDLRPGQELEGEDVEAPLTDQRYALNLFGAGVVYHGEPFAETTEVSGQVKLSLWMALDVPDTDFKADLYEILPNGGSVLLTSDLLRARYRDSMETESPVPLGKAVRYDFTGFTWFSRRVAKGSRLRLVVSCINSTAFEKNYNSGGVVADETAGNARTAHVIVYHDADHPSSLEIPIVR
jgi:putative CocE/NonD family hydrolase